MGMLKKFFNATAEARYLYTLPLWQTQSPFLKVVITHAQLKKEKHSTTLLC